MIDKNGKYLTREHYTLLKELGIEVFMYDLKVYTDKKVSYGFTLWGSLDETVDFDELLFLLKLLKVSKESDKEAVKEMYNQLAMMLHLLDDE